MNRADLWKQLDISRLFEEREAAYEEAIRVEGQYIAHSTGLPIRYPKFLTDAAMVEMDEAWEKHRQAEQAFNEAMAKLAEASP